MGARGGEGEGGDILGIWVMGGGAGCDDDTKWRRSAGGVVGEGRGGEGGGAEAPVNPKALIDACSVDVLGRCSERRSETAASWASRGSSASLSRRRWVEHLQMGVAVERAAPVECVLKAPK